MNEVLGVALWKISGLELSGFLPDCLSKSLTVRKAYLYVNTSKYMQITNFLRFSDFRHINTAKYR